jgi:hypothetical protein
MWKPDGTAEKRGVEFMSIDAESILDFDTLADTSFEETIEEFRSKTPPLCTLTCSPGSVERLKDFLCRLRAEGVAAVVVLRSTGSDLEQANALGVFEVLRDWDQLLLRNILELSIGWIPREFHEPLKLEAKTELKWFEQWQTASHDSRIHRYPALPWRSFLRKINAENFQFISDLMDLSHRKATPESNRTTAALIKQFLDAKKKTICIFPKRWN